MSEKPGSRRRRILKNVLVSVLVLGTIGGGVAYTAVTADGADRTAPTVAWAEPTPTVESDDPAEGIARGRASTPLSKLLLPMPVGYRLGSDIEGYGNDGELGARQAADLLKATGKGVYGKKRREYERRIDALGLQGMAMRSYAGIAADVQVEVLVMRMKDKKAVRNFYALRTELAGYLKLRKGPKVEDHERNAACHLLPEPTEGDKEEKEAQLRGMTCTAYTGEFLVSVAAYGAAPLDGKAIAELLAKQLGHIDSPGEYV
ncbi:MULTISPECIES: hypothetical protein [Streptomyces]|uniref:Secreted protein n=1 Tax=Streptomyces viridochromogenes TaxID=1938 RepID=A0A0L8J7Y0_STRVR|nr:MULTISPECIES: hypothetical protein [Streptomyces]KOG09730.1 hypothetical protein ADK34_36825 [Streptomyces viridochromogenes]